MIWNKLFKRSLFERNHISWEQGINMGEDLLMMLKILSHPVKIAYQPLPFYHYRRVIGGTSYTNNLSISSFNQLLQIRKWTAENIDREKYQNGLFCQWLDQAFAGLRVKNGMTARYYNDSTLNNINYVGFFKYKYPRLKGLIVLVAKIFGYWFCKWIVNHFYKCVYK